MSWFKGIGNKMSDIKNNIKNKIYTKPNITVNNTPAAPVQPPRNYLKEQLEAKNWKESHHYRG
jgi:hypothetical protein